MINIVSIVSTLDCYVLIRPKNYLFLFYLARMSWSWSTLKENLLWETSRYLILMLQYNTLFTGWEVCREKNCVLGRPQALIVYQMYVVQMSGPYHEKLDWATANQGAIDFSGFRTGNIFISSSVMTTKLHWVNFVQESLRTYVFLVTVLC